MFHQTNYTGGFCNHQTDCESIARLIGEACPSVNLKKDGSNYFSGVYEYTSEDKALMITLRRVQRVDDVVDPSLKCELGKGFSYWLLTDSTVRVADLGGADKLPSFSAVGKNCGVKMHFLCLRNTVSKAAMKTIINCVDDYSDILVNRDYPDLNILYTSNSRRMEPHPDMFNFIPLRYQIDEFRSESVLDLISTGWCSHCIEPGKIADMILYHEVNNVIAESATTYDCEMSIINSITLDISEDYINDALWDCDPVIEESLDECRDCCNRWGDESNYSNLSVDVISNSKTISVDELFEFVKLS